MSAPNYGLKPTVLLTALERTCNPRPLRSCSNALHQIQIPALEMSNAEADRIDFDLGKDPLRRSEGMLLVGKNFCQFRGDARESKRRSMEQALERLEPPSLLLVVHARRLRQPH